MLLPFDNSPEKSNTVPKDGSSVQMSVALFHHYVTFTESKNFFIFIIDVKD